MYMFSISQYPSKNKIKIQVTNPNKQVLKIKSTKNSDNDDIISAITVDSARRRQFS